MFLWSIVKDGHVSLFLSLSLSLSVRVSLSLGPKKGFFLEKKCLETAQALKLFAAGRQRFSSFVRVWSLATHLPLRSLGVSV